MTLAMILIGDRDWLPATLCVVITAALLLFCSYRKLTSPARKHRLFAACMKAAGFTILASCLVEPLWSSIRSRTGANIFLLLADNSQSMQIRDAEGSRTRGEELKRLFQDTSPAKRSDWQTRIGQEFDVRHLSFGTQLKQEEDFSSLSFDKSSSSLRGMLDAVRDQFKGRPLGGLILFTDGNATDVGDQQLELAGLPPIYPVVIGSGRPLKDIAIKNVSVTETAFEDAPVSIQFDVTARGYESAGILAQLQDSTGKVVNQESATFVNETTPLTFRMKLRPDKLETSFYRVRVCRKGDVQQFDPPHKSSEITLANNARLIQVDRGAQPHRILYVGGRPNWEFKFLRRAIEDDPNVELVGLIRVAKREAKFDFRGRSDESSNPLFRGFKKIADEETERYDQPVLVRLNTKDAAELRDGFPVRAEDLYRYQAIILDDIEAAFFSHDQKSLIEKYVSERGGSLLMCGGLESFQQGEYDRTPIGQLLPVYLDRAGAPRSNSRFRLKLTRTGWLYPWVRLRGSEADERQRLEEMPDFHTLNRVRNVKPGATVLASAVDDRGQQHPALVVHRFGQGRAAALTFGDLWRWQLKRHDEDDLGKAWRQLLRWLVADVPDRIELKAAASADSSDRTININVRVRDADFQPLDNAMVNLAIRRAPEIQMAADTGDGLAALTVDTSGNESIRIESEPALREPGLYEAKYVPSQPGAYLATVSVKDEQGKPLGTATSGWTHEPAVTEFRSIEPNRALLQTIADATGGELVRPEQLDDFVTGLSARAMPVTEKCTSPLWDQPWIFLLAIGCLVAEWGLRRWKGLP